MSASEWYTYFAVQQDDLVIPTCITVSGVQVHFFMTFSYCDTQLCVNSSRLSAAYMRQWIWSAFVQIMACRLIGTNPLFKPMLSRQLTFNRNTKHFIHGTHLQCRLRKWRPFCRGGRDELADLFFGMRLWFHIYDLPTHLWDWYFEDLEIPIRSMPENPISNKSMLLQVMNWCRKAIVNCLKLYEPG